MHIKTCIQYSTRSLLASYKVRTVDGERFAGLKVCIFNPIEVFTETLSRFLDQKYLLFSIIKERHLYSRENFHGTLENQEKHKSLAQRIFPRLQYVILLFVFNTVCYGYLIFVKIKFLWIS